jgi:hypothetical protein
VKDLISSTFFVILMLVAVAMLLDSMGLKF